MDETAKIIEYKAKVFRTLVSFLSDEELFSLRWEIIYMPWGQWSPPVLMVRLMDIPKPRVKCRQYELLLSLKEIDLGIVGFIEYRLQDMLHKFRFFAVPEQKNDMTSAKNQDEAGQGKVG